MDAEEKEAQIRAKYRKEIEAKVQEELNRIKEAQREKQNVIEVEKKAKEAKLSMMEKIRKELNKIKELDNAKKVTSKEESQSKARKEAGKKAKEEEDERQRLEANRRKVLQGIQAQRMEEELQIREEARKLRLESEAKREKVRRKQEREEQEAKAAALEEEKRRIAEFEEEERQRKVEAEIQARREESRRVQEKIAARKKEEHEREIQRQRDLQEQIARDNEALRKKELELKKQRFMKEQESVKKEKISVKRNSLQNNAILQKFELLTKAAEEEEIRKREAMKKRAIKRMPTLSIHKALKKSQNLKTKDKCRKSKENLKKSINRLVQKSTSKCKLMVHIKEENNEANVSKKDMQNYLISKVLFDGDENVDIREKTPEKVIEEDNFKERFFEAYKEGMEKYLSLFEGKDSKKTKSKVKASKKVEPVFTPVNNLRNQFEFPSQNAETNVERLSKTNRKGKLREFKDVFRLTEEHSSKSKSYVPIIIDRDAFERTLGKFESGNQKEDKDPGISDDGEEDFGTSVHEDSLQSEESMVIEGEESSVSLSESEPDPVGEVRNKILFELTKIKEAEKQFNDKIEKENKKRNLIRAIQDEIAKIDALTQIDPDDSNEEPEWIKRFQSFNKPQESTIKDFQGKTVIAQETKSNEAFEVHKEESKETESTLDYQQIIEALLSLTQDSDSAPKASLDKGTTTKKPITIKAVSDMKDKFEGSDSKSNKSPAAPSKEPKGNKIDFVKNVLFAAKGSTPSSQSSDTSTIKMKKASSLRNTFEKKCNEEKELTITREKIHRRSSIKVPQVFSTQCTMNDTAIGNMSNLKREWKYKQKQMTDLGYFLKDNARTLPPEILIQGTKVLENHNDDPIEALDSNEGESLIDSVNAYLTENGDSLKESAFKETLQGYLDLIDDDTPTLSNKATSIKLNSTKTNIRALQSKLTSEETVNKRTKKQVGKIDRDIFQENRNDFKTDNVKAISKNHGLCSDIKEHLERKCGEKEIEKRQIKRKKIIVNVPKVKEDVSNLSSPTNKKENWKWKTKDPMDLWVDNSDPKIDTNKETDDGKIIVFGTTDREREDLIKRSHILKVKTQEREKEYKEFISTLRNYSTQEANGTNSEVDSYLQLIGEQTSKTEPSSLPQIDVPWKINHVKNKLIQASQKVNEPSKASLSESGKLQFMKERMAKGSKRLEIKVDKDFTNSKPITGIKSQFEEIMKSGGRVRKSLSEMNLAPVRRQKKLIPEYKQVIREPEMKEKSGKWQNKIFDYFQPETKKQTSVVKLNQSESKVQSKWESIVDPEERKRAILAKHGFKPYKNKKEESLTENFNEQDTYCSEKAYKEYLKEHTGIDDSESEDESKDRNPGGSISTLLNILGSVRKSMNKEDRMAQSEMDISQIPGTCSNMRRRFEDESIESPPRDTNVDYRRPSPQKLRKGSFDNLFRSESSSNLSMRSELDVLRSSSTLRRQFSEQNLDSGKLLSGRMPSTADLESEVLEELSRSNSAIKAMFEASAPKYKFGQKLRTQQQQQEEKKRPSPRQQNKETRQWVLDSVNKYFDVIVEEEEEECEGKGLKHSDSEDETREPKSHLNMKNLVISAMKQYKNVSQECLLQNFKKNLGSQLQLKRESMECLNA